MILLGADPLTRFLNRAAATPFEWGRHDCLLWLADWVTEQSGSDPAGSLRGSYSTMLQAARIVRDEGGMRRLVDARMNWIGARRAIRGARGHIAIVSIEGQGGEHFGDQAGAILLGGSAALICQDGLIVRQLVDAPVIAAWRV